MQSQTEKSQEAREVMGETRWREHKVETNSIWEGKWVEQGWAERGKKSVEMGSWLQILLRKILRATGKIIETGASERAYQQHANFFFFARLDPNRCERKIAFTTLEWKDQLIWKLSTVRDLYFWWGKRLVSGNDRMSSSEHLGRMEQNSGQVGEQWGMTESIFLPRSRSSDILLDISSKQRQIDYSPKGLELIIS